jgi:DNA polymerase I|tara:strand:- start:1112 stop:2161 length:1050 start_codon:yes stop_codon:yes gene_type:complete
MKGRFFDILQEVERDHKQGMGSSKDSHLLIIDGLNTFIRVFSAVPALNDDGMHIGGVTGFLRSIAAAIRQHKPTRCVIVFDGKGGSVRRKQMYPDYKANRANKTAFNRYEEFASLQDEQESMKRQYGRMIQYLQCLPITTLAIDNIEADDAIAYIANEIFTKPENRATIVSTDRDFLQLVNNRISVWSPTKKKMYTPNTMREEFGIDASNYLLYRALTGDKSDNIPGVNGVGLKTMIRRLPIITENKQLSVEELVEYASNVEKKYKVHEIIESSSDIIQLNYKLMQLKNVDIAGNTKLLILEKVREEINKMDVLNFKKMFMVDKMYTVIKDLDTWMTTSFNSLNAFRNL